MENQTGAIRTSNVLEKIIIILIHGMLGEIKGNKKLEQIFEKVMSNESQNKLMK